MIGLTLIVVCGSLLWKNTIRPIMQTDRKTLGASVDKLREQLREQMSKEKADESMKKALKELEEEEKAQKENAQRP